MRVPGPAYRWNMRTCAKAAGVLAAGICDASSCAESETVLAAATGTWSRCTGLGTKTCPTRVSAWFASKTRTETSPGKVRGKGCAGTCTTAEAPPVRTLPTLHMTPAIETLAPSSTAGSSPSISTSIVVQGLGGYGLPSGTTSRPAQVP